MNTSRPSPLLAVVALVALGAAACSSEEASPRPSEPTATLPPAATTTVATTTVPATTAPPTTTTTVTPTTALPTTTTPPPSGIPIDARIPLLVGGAGTGGWLSLGEWAVTDWAPAFLGDGTPIAPQIAEGSTLAITGLQAGADTGTTGPSVEACFDGRNGPRVDAAVNAPSPPGFGYSAVALPAIWPLQPRPVVEVDATVPDYEAAGRAVFADDPVDGDRGAVEQIVLADLDGDGDEEAFVAFEFVQDSILGAPGDLAALLLVDTATGTTTTVESAFVGPIPDPPPTSAGESTTTVPAEGDPRPIIDRFRVLGVADLNGDGIMEVLVHTWYFEGAGVIAYAYDGETLTEVLRTGCGA